MSLSDLSNFIRSSVRWFLICLIALFALWVAWIFIRAASGLVVRPKGEDIAFGKIASPFFVKTYSTLDTNKFELSTSLPKSKEKESVYEFKSATKFTEQQINKIASFLGFKSSSQKKEGSLLIWGSSSETASLKLNTAQSHFSYSYNISKESISSDNITFSDKEALNKAREILQQLGLLPEDISKGTSTVKHLKISGSRRETVTADVANALEISLFRKITDNTSSGDAPIKLLFGASFKTLEFEYNYSPIDSLGSPYPVITSQEAWQNFQDGKAYTSTQTNFNSVIVTKVSLSYWESSLPQRYLQPVWLFIGKGNSGGEKIEFTAVYPAVTSSYLSD